MKKALLGSAVFLLAWMILSCGPQGGGQEGPGEASAPRLSAGETARKFVDALKSKGDAVALVAARTHMKECSPRTRDMFKRLKIDKAKAARLLVVRAKNVLSGYNVTTAKVTEAGDYAYVAIDLQPAEGSIRTAPAAGVLTLALEKGRWGVLWIEATSALRGKAPEPLAHWLGPKAR